MSLISEFQSLSSIFIIENKHTEENIRIPKTERWISHRPLRAAKYDIDFETSSTQPHNRKRFIDDLEEDEFSPNNKAPSKNGPKKLQKCNFNLAEPDAEKNYSRTINLGKGFMMELKEFRNAYYIVKFGDGQEVRNRFNIPIVQIAVEAMSNYVDAN
ncbi:hypothetical protein CDAR_270441 [Caerostris darwini]|uniref:Uncharacterized protein n=1 Tax=Caerostris darwini TaxID=1538125 RepID=A0AAV4NHR5_9ARAC|nr:hypothetical protein CDAR_270441 [Caerostris darwini]